jgi:WD40 repeat protein/predicted Ser/Thr protein kinase
MSQPVVCPHGHPWEVLPGAASEVAVTRCPACAVGALPLSSSISTATHAPADELPPPPLRPARASPRAAAVPSAPPDLPEIAGYEILCELGRGGMGVVYKARQLGLDRVIALKMVLAGAHAGLQERARFRREAEAVARLQHPQIVQVHEVGEEAGRPYFAMEFLEGGSLAQKLGGNPLAARQAAEVVQRLARAVHYAHQRGVVHRDLKPTNVLLAADGTEKVTDFGLARRLDQGTGRTRTGDVLGTPSYMAPEQASGKSHEIGPAVDIYGLGGVLYDLLTGRPPFEAATPWETVHQVLAEELVPPTRLQPRVPRDLETICLKCLQKEPRQRYASAAALADDLGRFLEGRPILARPVGPLGRGWRWCRRNPAVAGLLAAVAGTLLLGMGLASYFALQATERAREAEASAHRADQEAERTRQEKRTSDRLLYAAHMNLAQRAWEDGQLARLLGLLDGQRPERTGGVDLRGFEWYYLWRLCHRGHRWTLRGHQRPVSAVAYAPDSRTLATGSDDATVKLWDVATGQERLTLRGLTGPVPCLAFSPDGQTLATGSNDHPIQLWDVATGQARTDLKGVVAQLQALAFSPDGKTVAATSNWMIKLWDVATGQEQAVLPGNGPMTNALAYSPDGKLLASGGNDQTVKLWDVETGQEIARLGGHGTYVVSVAFSPDGATLASGGVNGLVKFWDVATRKERTTLASHTGGVNSLAFSPDGSTLVSGGWDGTIAVRRLDTDQVRRLGHAGPIQCVAFAPDGRTLASGSADGTAKVWDAAMEQEQPLQHASGVYAVAFSPDGRTVASGGIDPDLPVRLWDVTTGKERLPPLRGHTKPVRSMAFAPGRNLLATGSEDRTIKLWDLATGQERITLHGHSADVWSVAFSVDGTTLASAGYTDRTVRLWDVDTGREQAVLMGHRNRIWCVAFSPEGKTVASGDADGNLKLWDVATAAARDLGSPQAEDWLWCVAFSPDGATVAAGFAEGKVVLWDVATGDGRRALPGHPAAVRALAFSPDSQLLATAGDDNTIKLWDLTTRQERATLRGHKKRVWGLAFSPDGTTLASGSDDKTVRLWRAATAEEVAAQSSR